MGEDLGPALALGSLRLWLGVRALLTGVEKFAGTRTVEQPLLDEFGEPDLYGTMIEAKEKVYGISQYQGVPGGLADALRAEPLIPGFLFGLYDWMLGPVLIILGITVLLGVCLRWSLFLMGALYTSLTVGLILLQQDAGIAWLGVHLGLVAIALMLARHHRCFVGRRWSHL